MISTPQSASDSQPLLKRVRAYLRSERFQFGAIVAVGTLLSVLLFITAVSPTRYTLYAGMVPTATISATKDVVDTITTEQNRQAAAAAVTPVYIFAEGTADQVMLDFENLLLQYAAVRQYAQSLPDHSSARRYTQEETDYAGDIITLADFRDYQLVTLMNSSDQAYDELISALRAALRNTMQGHVTQGQENIAIDSIMQVVGYKTSVSLLQNVVLPTLQSVVAPNMVIDVDSTDAARQAAMEAVEPVVFKQGQNIVVRGEGRLKQNQIEMLSDLGLLSQNRSDNRVLIGAASVSLLVLMSMYALLQAARPQLVSNHRRLLLIYAVVLAVLLLCYLTKTLLMVYLAPMVLAAMLLTVMLGFMPALIIHGAVSLLAGFILGTSTGATTLDIVLLTVSSLISGTVAAVILGRRAPRSLLLVAGLASMAVSFLVVFTIGLVFDSNTGSILSKATFAAGGALISTALCLALQPVLETMFNLPTNNRLMELSNPNHPLLRRLLLEAPGTYHHSILIANMAETAAEAVGANPLLARVGGYYHDIGKLKRPLYFKENQIGSANIHDTTDPTVSAAIITSHVRDGLALAKQYRLPWEVRQIVEHHHGNSRVQYFYSKAIQEGSEPVDEDSFRYEGRPPQSAEAAIVMLCDTIEAAVRSLNSTSREEISAFIWKLIRGKLDDGQLMNAPLTLHDLTLIQATCANVVYGIFHERIEYPSDDSPRLSLSKLRGSLWGSGSKAGDQPKTQ